MSTKTLTNRILTVCRTMLHGEPILFVEGTLAQHRGNSAIQHYKETWHKEVPDPQHWHIVSITYDGKCSIRNEYIETTLVDIDVNEII